MRGWLLALALLGGAPAFAQLPDSSPGKSEISAKNVMCGLLSAKPAGRSSGLLSKSDAGNRFRFEEETKEFAAKRGLSFGIVYRLRSYLGTGTTPIRVVFTYPEPGLRNPATGKTSLSSESTSAKKYEIEQIEAHTFAEDWELVPGKWVVQVFDRQKKLAECAFKVIKPESDPGPPTARKP